MQVFPFNPHAASVGGAVHAAPLQHPEGQDVESQTHAPAEQRWPEPHALFEPHLQVPSPAQTFVFARSHATHVVPAFPQVVVERAVQVVPTQHPVGQETASQPPPMQLPDLHVCAAPHAGFTPHRHSPALEQLSALSAAQAVQAPPLMPQAVRLGVATQALPAEQHPVEQLVESQTQPVPATQR